MYRISRPTELADHLTYVSAYAPDFPEEDNYTTATAFTMAFEALKLFKEATPTEEGKERIAQCERNLHVAFELFEHGDNDRASRLVEETEDMFQKARKFIALSDE